MATTSGIGRSSRRDPQAAARELSEQVLEALAGRAPDFLLLFATARYDQATLTAAVADAFPGVPLSGCSGEGIIAGPVSDESEYAVALLAVQSDSLRFIPFLVEGYAAEPAAAGRRLAADLAKDLTPDAVALLLFPDGLLGNCAELLEELGRVLPATLPVVGGTAGDALTFEGTYQYLGGRAVSGGVAAVLIRGRGGLEIAVSHGCVPIGLEHNVTRVGQGWMQEIDGRPAWSVFREYLEGNPDELNTEGALHLSVGESLPAGLEGEYEDFVIRTPLGLDKESGALFFPGGGIPDGRAIRLTRRDPARVCESARACARKIANRRPGRAPAIVLQFDCAGRGHQLFGSAVSEQLVKPLQQELGVTVPWIGFHTYGEIAPIGGRTFYHNFTVALCALYDEE